MSQGQVNPTCPKCGFANNDAFHFCPKCRFPLLHLASKYRLERALAQGGMGQVYLANHIRLDHDTERVIKVIKPEIFAAPGMDVRFRREVQVTAALSQRNDHIVRIYDDFGEAEGLGHYYVMEYLRGQTLRDLMLPGNPLAPEIAYHIFYQFCRAMAAAHREKIVHRDLKPDNIYLIHREDDEHYVKVIDFGIARPQDADSGTPLTQGILGTPQYMSPEQCENKAVDQRSDIYSMAMILHEMLSGTHAYGLTKDELSGSSPLGMISAHLMKSPIPLHEVCGDVSPALSEVVLQALARKPDERIESVEAFWNALAETEPLGHPMPLIGDSSSNKKLLRTSGMMAVMQPSSSAQEQPVMTAALGSSTSRVQASANSPEKPDEPDAPNRTLLWVFSVVGLLAFGVIVWFLMNPPAKDPPPKRMVARASMGKTPGAAAAPRTIKRAAPATPRRKKAVPPRRADLPSPIRRPEPRRRKVKPRAPKRRTVRRRRLPRRRRPVVRRAAGSGICGAAGSGYRYAFARLRKPAKGRARLQFMGCRTCRSKRRRGGYCLRVPDNDTVRMRISVNGYISCTHKISPAMKKFGWTLKLEDPDELADEHYACAK